MPQERPTLSRFEVLLPSVLRGTSASALLRLCPDRVPFSIPAELAGSDGLSGWRRLRDLFATISDPWGVTKILCRGPFSLVLISRSRLLKSAAQQRLLRGVALLALS